MTVAVLVTGVLFREPQQKRSQAGKSYVSATLKASTTDNSAAEFWNLLVFSETAQAELMRLGLNERVAAQGALKLELYEKEGQTRLSRTVFVDQVLALRAPPREKKPKPSNQRPAPERAPPLERVNILPPASSGLPDDDIPF